MYWGRSGPGSGALGEDLLERTAVIKGQSVVDAGVVEPEPLQLAEPLGLVVSQVLDLGTVLLEVVELPDVLVEASQPEMGGWSEHANQPWW